MPDIAAVSAPGLQVAIVHRKRPAYGWQPVPGGARTVKLSRKPTPLEERLISLADIPERLDAEVKQLAAALTLLRRAYDDPERAVSPDAVRDTRSLLLATQVAVANYGAFERRQEWSRQGILLSLSDGPWVDANADVAADPHLQATISMRAERLCREWAGALTELRHAHGRRWPTASPDHFERYSEKWLSSGVVNVAKQVVNGAFAFGRQRENHKLISLKAVEAETYVYTAIMDSNTCMACEEKDGQEFDPDTEGDEYAVPSPECEGGPDRCRCIWLAVGGDDEGWIDARVEHARLMQAFRLARHHV